MLALSTSLTSPDQIEAMIKNPCLFQRKQEIYVLGSHHKTPLFGQLLLVKSKCMLNYYSFNKLDECVFCKPGLLHYINHIFEIQIIPLFSKLQKDQKKEKPSLIHFIFYEALSVIKRL